MIKPLTSLRFVFAFMVFMSHNILFDKAVNPFLHHLFYEGCVGVSFFFILSGFILSHVYQEGFEDKRVSKRKFYIARLARIYPLHIVTMLIWVYMRKDHPINEVYVTNFISNLSLTQSFYFTDEIRFNTAAWSLSDEMFFYLLFPFLIAWLAEAKKKFVGVFLLGASVVLVLCPIIEGSKYQEWLLYSFPPVRLLDFVVGILLYNVCQSVHVKNLVQKVSPTKLEVAAVLLFLSFYCIAYLIPEVYRYSIWYWLPVGLFISIFYFRAGAISQFLSKDTFVWLGDISFSFYMFHAIVLWYIRRSFVLADISVSKPIIFVLGVILTIVVSAISFKYLETPANKWIKTKLKQ